MAPDSQRVRPVLGSMIAINRVSSGPVVIMACCGGMDRFYIPGTRPLGFTSVKGLVFRPSSSTHEDS